MSEERFHVAQFFKNDTYEFVRRHVLAQEAVDAFRHYSNSVAAKLGMTVRVIIVDMGDMTCAEWKFGQGIVFPTPEMVDTSLMVNILHVDQPKKDDGGDVTV